jgi:hypothetical protein
LPPSEGGNEFNPLRLTGLPAKSIFVSDTESELLQKACRAISCSPDRLPLMIIVNGEGEIVFRSEGYTIGIGEQIIKTSQQVF